MNNTPDKNIGPDKDMGPDRDIEESWQEDIARTLDDPCIPQDDKARVLLEIDVLYNEVREYLISRGQVPCA